MGSWSAFIWRVILAVLAFAFIWAVIPLVLELVGLNLSAPLLQLLRLCTGALAIIYVIAGPLPPSLRVG